MKTFQKASQVKELATGKKRAINRANRQLGNGSRRANQPTKQTGKPDQSGELGMVSVQNHTDVVPGPGWYEPTGHQMANFKN